MGHRLGVRRRPLDPSPPARKPAHADVAVVARGSQRALALVTQSVAAALLGPPVDAPQAARPARERLRLPPAVRPPRAP